MIHFNWKHWKHWKHFNLMLSALYNKKGMFPVLQKEEALYRRHISRFFYETYVSLCELLFFKKDGNNGNNADNTTGNGGNMLETIWQHGGNMVLVHK